MKIHDPLTCIIHVVHITGFSRKGELDAFKKLITVSGVGAKAGIAILSAFTLEELEQAIVFEDSKSLTRANGIGKKTAERIVLHSSCPKALKRNRR